ncbi:LysR family transcriptional regulator [Ochrobactrum quorumnocens]|uniref:LysR substrate-binding domain-containing protein n=1 Tax=Ochrobactrum quorumnocens TaxID=271865 RepID=UPI000BA844CA|nr:LysR family transcriptional regulator [[Ochrobactrum] quorumnocens]
MLRHDCNPEIQLRQLHYVIAAAEHGSFRQAALAVGVQESAISRRIRDLEDQAGAALFIRCPRGVSLTEAGKKFLTHARRAINEIDLALKEVGAAGRAEKGVLRIGIFTSLASGFIAELLQRYREQNPGIRSTFVEGAPADHVVAVRRHEIDVAFLTGHAEVPSCEVTRLWCERVFVVLSETHELAAKDRIEWTDLRGRHFIVSEAEPGPEIHDYLVKHLAELGHRPSIERYPIYNRDTLMQMVALAEGITLTSEATTGTMFPGVTYRLLEADAIPFCAVWSSRNDNPALRRMLSLAKSLSKKRFATQPITLPDGRA